MDRRGFIRRCMGGIAAAMLPVSLLPGKDATATGTPVAIAQKDYHGMTVHYFYYAGEKKPDTYPEFSGMRLVETKEFQSVDGKQRGIRQEWVNIKE